MASKSLISHCGEREENGKLDCIKSVEIVAERCRKVGTAVEYLPFHFASAW